MPLPDGGSIPAFRNADMGLEGANEAAERGRGSVGECRELGPN